MALHLVLLLAMVPASSSFATTSEGKQADTVAAAGLNWRSLELQDSGLTGSVTTRIELGTYPEAEVQSVLVDAPDTVSQRAAGTRLVELGVASSIRSLPGVRIENQTRLWFNADDGLPIQLMRLRLGSKPSQKLYRFGSRQVYRQRRQPADKAEREQPAGHWREVSEAYYPLPGQDEACPIILESSQLLYVLSRQDTVLSESGGEFCVFDRKQVYRVGFRVLGREPLAVDYLQLGDNQETRVKRTLQASRVALTSRPLEGAAGDMQPFSFLGLDDDIELLLSEPGRIPLRIRGQVSGFGTIDLELKKLAR
jgi:hypothetical protein